MKLLVIDAQGGGIGRQLIAELKKAIDAEIIAIGTNSAAVSNMLKANPDQIATGENPVKVACRDVDIIVGPIGIVVADSMLGEITPEIAKAVGQSRAKKVLIPFRHCDNIIVGVENDSTSYLIEKAIEEVTRYIKENNIQ